MKDLEPRSAWRVGKRPSKIKSTAATNKNLRLNELLRVLKALRAGDFGVHMLPGSPNEGILGEIAEAVNDIVDLNGSLADEISRVGKAVGVEGKMSERVSLKSVTGQWLESSNAINELIGGLVQPTKEVARVITAVAKGDLSQKVDLDAKGEVADLKRTINLMVDQLNSFSAEVTRVAIEVGVEGKLGNQAAVPGASGTWRNLTENVNQLAGNLTEQVRAIAEVSTAVTNGDLTRSIAVEAKGELAALKNNINQMIGNLKETTQKYNEQDWLKTNLAKFSGMMQGQRSVSAVAQLIMSELTPLVNAQAGVFFLASDNLDDLELNVVASYAYTDRKILQTSYKLKEGLIGQCAFEKKPILLLNPPDDYVRISSSTERRVPKSIIVLPVLFEGELKAVIELSSVTLFSKNYLNFLDQLMDSIGVMLNMISSSMRTEELLCEIKKSNVELEAQAKELEEKAKLLEAKNVEVELASRSAEEKAEQLTLISQYKSEFLANMSHELRTPLNSLLLLSKNLEENQAGNLDEEQVKFAGCIHSAGLELLNLINEILDLSKVEAGKMTVDTDEFLLSAVVENLERTFNLMAKDRKVDFSIQTEVDVPKMLLSDQSRLLQILKNLISNAFKFTQKGQVSLEIKRFKSREVRGGLLEDGVSFAVRDTGIGIPVEKQHLIFEAFQQADGTTSRKYGGTGLGLTISRELSSLLGGIIEVRSQSGKGSEFTLYLPQDPVGSSELKKEVKPFELAAFPEWASVKSNLRGKQILIVDDDMRNIFALTSVFEGYGLSIYHANNGREALERLRDHPTIDLVLMDTMMPEMDGLEAIRHIRKMSHFRDLPIISLTAKAMKGDDDLCLAAGATAYLPKPVDMKELLSVMNHWLTDKFEQIDAKV